MGHENMNLICIEIWRQGYPSMTKQIVNKYRHFKSVPSTNVVVVLEVAAACFCLLSFTFCVLIMWLCFLP